MLIRLKFNTKELSFLSILYIVTYIAITFSGSTFIKPYILKMIITLTVLLAMMVIFKNVKKNAFLNTTDVMPAVLLLSFAAFLFWQKQVAYVPELCTIYARRYFIYSLLLIFIPKVNLANMTIKSCKYYSLLVALSILLMTFLTNRKTGGLVGNYQYAGMLMSIASILFLIDYFQQSNGEKNIIGLLLCLAGLFMSGKRMFAFLVGLSFVVIYVKEQNRNKRKKLVQFAFLMTIGMIVLYVTVPHINEIFIKFLNKMVDKQTFMSGRNVLWAQALSIFEQNKVYGIGFSAFSQYFNDHYRFAGIGAYLTHNIYVGLLAETGLIGFSIFVLFILVTILMTFRLGKAVKACNVQQITYVYTYSLAMQVWFIVYGFTGNGIYDADVSFFYFTAIAMMLSVKRYLEKHDFVKIKYRITL